MPSITDADAVLTLAVDFGLGIPFPTQLQGFSTDDIYDIPTIRSAEVQMGVDGQLSAGFVFVPVPQTIVLQGNSLSNRFFDAWWMQNQAAKTSYEATGFILLPSIASSWVQTVGHLTGYKPAPAAKRVIQPRTYEITWESIRPVPVG